jgi:hypothetical protein
VSALLRPEHRRSLPPLPLPGQASRMSCLPACLPGPCPCLPLPQGMQGLVDEVGRSHGELSRGVEAARAREAAARGEAQRARRALAHAASKIRWVGAACSQAGHRHACSSHGRVGWS